MQGFREFLIEMADHYHLWHLTGKILKHDHPNSRTPHGHAGFVQHSNTLKGIEKKQKIHVKKLDKHFGRCE